MYTFLLMGKHNFWFGFIVTRYIYVSTVCVISSEAATRNYKNINKMYMVVIFALLFCTKNCTFILEPLPYITFIASFVHLNSTYLCGRCLVMFISALFQLIYAFVVNFLLLMLIMYLLTLSKHQECMQL